MSQADLHSTPEGIGIDRVVCAELGHAASRARDVMFGCVSKSFDINRVQIHNPVSNSNSSRIPGTALPQGLNRDFGATCMARLGGQPNFPGGKDKRLQTDRPSDGQTGDSGRNAKFGFKSHCKTIVGNYVQF